VGGVTISRARIIAVGDELLEGRTVDTNSGCVQRALAGAGIPVVGVEVVPDDSDAIGLALSRTVTGELVVLTGGLGSTPDDLTREAVATWAGVDLAEDSTLRRRMTERWQRRGVSRRAGVERQCQVPAGCEAVENPVGSAPGLVGRLAERTVVLLPGVPAEMESLLPLVVALLRGKDLLPEVGPQRLWRTAQVAELALVERCAAVRSAHPDLHWSWWLTEWGCDVRLAMNAGGDESVFDQAAADVDEALGRVAYSRGDETLPAAVQRLLLAAGRTLSVAESCTGGLIAARLTDTPGASACFSGGVVSYADRIKVEYLDVPAEVLESHGAVSEEVATAMAAGCRRRLATDYALAVSGISGPDGGTADKPVGTTWVALATPTVVFARRYRFTADRPRNRLLTVAAALDSLRRLLETDDSISPWYPGDTWSRLR